MRRAVARATAVLSLLGLLCGTAPAAAADKLLAELRALPFKILYESRRGGNWELILANADGSHAVNLTNTPHVDEMFPHASPDGKKVVFVAEDKKAAKRARHVYCMNIDGTGRVKIGENGRQPFWSPDGRAVAYLRGTRVTYSEGGGANKEMHFWDVETGKHSLHPKRDIAGLLNPCWSPDGKWVVASVMGGMGLGHSIVAIEARGTRVVELARSHTEGKNIYQCRPDVSPDGRRVAWGKEDVDNRLGFGRRTMWIEVASLDLGAATPKVASRRRVVTAKRPEETYHVDWSPDGQYIAYARGPRATGRMARARYVVGAEAPGWDIWVVKPTRPEVAVRLTRDGLSNKEPDWVVVRQRGAAR